MPTATERALALIQQRLDWLHTDEARNEYEEDDYYARAMEGDHDYSLADWLTMFAQRAIADVVCEVTGHDWYTWAADPENGSEDLCCRRCGFSERVYHC